jgi:hypothetical protein
MPDICIEMHTVLHVKSHYFSLSLQNYNISTHLSTTAQNTILLLCPVVLQFFHEQRYRGWNNFNEQSGGLSKPQMVHNLQNVTHAQ